MTDLRYQNHLSLQDFDQEVQNRISQSTITIFGLGGLGSVCSLYLSNAGAGKMNLVDYDSVDETNLPRQVLYRPDQVGRNKALAAKSTLAEFNPNTEINCFNEKLIGDDLQKLVNESSLVIDATDNLSSRLQINEACHLAKVHHIVGTAIRFEGQVMTFDHSNDQNPCFQCLYSLMDENLEDCDGAGVLSTVAGTVGLLMANNAIKTIIGNETYDRMLILDLKHNIIQNISIKKNDNCSICI
ncbi:MAG: molybdopterin-synthase adenylyltransferase MoeB [Gammaproteobacteria bacterium]|nr:molybdopterin-synthase adenylyltransferase MoeB [Gammaproteobacteria bacterium]